MPISLGKVSRIRRLESESTYHLKPLLHWGSALEVLGSSLDVEVNLLLTEIDHMAREERLSVLLEVLLISVKHAIQPREELLGAIIKSVNIEFQGVLNLPMISVQDDWNTIAVFR